MTSIAIIDSGTNTFAISLYDIAADGRFHRQYKESIYVFLAEQGLERISEAAIGRAQEAYRHFKNIIEAKGIATVKAVGTAALRSASNGPDLVARIKSATGIEIEIIDGMREAMLIYQGVCMAAPLTEKADLIIDIGGGSVEFILCNKAGLIWAQSFPLGAALLYNKFQVSEPIHPTQILALQAFFEEALAPLLAQLAAHPIEQLIGASGTFDALEAMLGQAAPQGHYGFIDLDKMARLYQLLLPTTHSQRLDMELLPKSRAKLIVVALLLIEWVVDRAGLKNPLVVSDYALKEGLLWEEIFVKKIVG